MPNMMESAKNNLKELVSDAYQKAVSEGVLPAGAPEPDVDVPRDPTHGDWSSNFAMASAKALKLAPRAVAEAVVARIVLTGSFFSSVEIAGPGFLNARLSEHWYHKVLTDIETSGEDYGKINVGQGARLMVEFVSANPTGPMTVGNARGGVLGDALASVLSAAGYDVWREFYLNDAGHQVEMFGRSLEARYLQTLLGEDACPFPEDGYHGAYIMDIAKAFIDKYGDSYVQTPGEERLAAMIAFGLPLNITRMESDLYRYRIAYDCWYPESSLHKSGYIEQTIDLLTQRGCTYEKDGALWFRATDFGSDKDDVLKKSNGFYTYYAVDIAYHRDKLEKRAFDIVVDVLGADHHGHTLRFQAAMAALGIDPARLRFVLYQLVHLTRDGEVVRVSKRTGRAITLSDLLDEIPVDAARFFFNQRQTDVALDFDLGLAVRQDADNPVYYVQYAHARICNLIKVLNDEGLTASPAAQVKISLLSETAERDLLRALAAFPEEIRMAARDYEPARINRYAIELAAAFHRFYNAHRMKGTETELASARLKLAESTRQVLRNALKLLGISAPDNM